MSEVGALMCSVYLNVQPERRSISPMEIKASVTPKHNQHSVSDGKCSKCSKSRDSPPAATSTQEQTNHFLPTLAISPQETQRHSSPVSSEKLQGLGPLCILSSGDHLKDLPAFLLSAKRCLSFWSNLPNELYCTLESTSVSGANFMNGEQTSSAHVADSPSEDEVQQNMCSPYSLNDFVLYSNFRFVCHGVFLSGNLYCMCGTF
jgi:hypothetical protein